MFPESEKECFFKTFFENNYFSLRLLKTRKKKLFFKSFFLSPKKNLWTFQPIISSKKSHEVVPLYTQNKRWKHYLFWLFKDKFIFSQTYRLSLFNLCSDKKKLLKIQVFFFRCFKHFESLCNGQAKYIYLDTRL